MVLLLTASWLGKAFGTWSLFDGISVSLESRHRVGLIGPNGCGKTTLLRVLPRDLPPLRRFQDGD